MCLPYIIPDNVLIVSWWCANQFPLTISMQSTSVKDFLVLNQADRPGQAEVKE